MSTALPLKSDIETSKKSKKAMRSFRVINTGVKLDGKSIWKIHMDFFSKIFFFLICFNTYEL